MTRLTLSLLCLVFMTQGCCSCPVAKAPERAAQSPDEFPKDFLAYLNSACYDEAYDLLSPRTRKKYGFYTTKYVLLRRPIPGTEVTILDIARHSQSLAVIDYERPGPKGLTSDPNRRFWILEDHIPDQNTQRCRLYNLLLQREAPGADRWTLALQDQIEEGIPFLGE